MKKYVLITVLFFTTTNNLFATELPNSNDKIRLNDLPFINKPNAKKIVLMRELQQYSEASFKRFVLFGKEGKLESVYTDYLPLTGGTLTGPLIGTSAIFSSSIINTNGGYYLDQPTLGSQDNIVFWRTTTGGGNIRWWLGQPSWDNGGNGFGIYNDDQSMWTLEADITNKNVKIGIGGTTTVESLIGANANLSGNVGIGTTSPQAKLHINNGDNSYGAILANASESNFSLYTKTITTAPINVESFGYDIHLPTIKYNSLILSIKQITKVKTL